ncbi:MAG: ankyrin repeat domain-containing protein [Opitutae bacterium]|nr:ankyrin repeat domain-containing protein [Opitutae bacterium]
MGFPLEADDMGCRFGVQFRHPAGACSRLDDAASAPVGDPMQERRKIAEMVFRRDQPVVFDAVAAVDFMHGGHGRHLRPAGRRKASAAIIWSMEARSPVSRVQAPLVFHLATGFRPILIAKWASGGMLSPMVESPKRVAAAPQNGDVRRDRSGEQGRFQTTRSQAMRNGRTVLFALSWMLLPLLTGCLGLHKAVGRGDLAKAGQFLQKGVEVDARDSYGRTPLMWATTDLSAVQYLVDKGADVNAKDINGETALMKAAFLGQLDVVKYLVKKGADVNARSGRGETPLMWGVSDLGVVQYLAEQGAEVNARDSAGETPLMKAAVSGRLRVVRYLLDKGATVDAGAEPGGTR